jgi:putative glutamine amidotransferase
MISPAPRIAIPQPTSTDADYNNRSLPQYVQAIEAAGGIAIPIPLSEPASEQEALLASCSGILLPGSPADVDPERYGAERQKETAAKDILREATDDRLLRGAFADGKPIFGICFGLQSLNVFQGGTLIQHVPAVQPANRAVNHEPGRTVDQAHPVRIAPETRLASIVHASPGNDPFVNSSHHQAIGKPGESLKIAATSPEDGIIEALEGTQADPFVLAVQWHPERTYTTSAESRALFASFLEAARNWKPCNR